MTTRVYVLGEDGITGKAVISAIQRLPDYERVLVTTEADIIVVSPGVPPAQFPDTSATIMAEVEFAYQLFQQLPSPPKLVGITGTNGKTTVTQMCRAITGWPAAGNIGVPLVEFVGRESVPEGIVVELSSYQLEQIHQFRADVSILLNITPDHLERHGCMRDYREQKLRIMKNQRPDDTVIYFEDDAELSTLVTGRAKGPTVGFGGHDCESVAAALPDLFGWHNQLNAAAALKAGDVLQLDPEKMRASLADFQNPEHRVEQVASSLPYHFVNDSKATNPDATIAAIQSINTPIHLIICGTDKGLPLSPLLAKISAQVATVWVFGDIASRFIGESADLPCPITKVAELSEAVNQSMLVAKPGDTLLFSPACSSFDMYANFEERGRMFKQLVENL